MITLDSSSGMEFQNFQLAKNFSARLASAFTSHEPSKFGFNTFAVTVDQVLSLENTLTPSETEGKIMGVGYMGTAQRITHEGIDAAKSELERYGPGKYVRISSIICNFYEVHEPQQYATTPSLICSVVSIIYKRFM
jgi:hypothetical protein